MEKTLVILAAGMGSRFGGLKQLSPVGPSGEFIIDYSIYDALKAGFNKIVFVIRKDHYNDFHETIGKRVEKFVKVEYAYQENEPNLKREKPLGTGHALYCAKSCVHGPFALISADDFYGPEAFVAMSKFLDENNDKVGVLGYNLASTINNPEGVKRGVIFEENNEIKELVECKVVKKKGYIEATEIQGDRSYKLGLDAYANMLIFAFSMDVFPLTSKMFQEFMQNSDPEKDEFILTIIIDHLIKEGKASLIKAKGTWMGMTYKEDLVQVQEKIKDDIKKGIYKEDLWSKNERENWGTY